MGWIDPTDRVNGDVLDADLWNQDVVANTLAIFRHLTPVGTVIPYGGIFGENYGHPDDGRNPSDYSALADPDVGAPFHLPCTGGIYETADFPLLSQVLGHTFCNHQGGDDMTREDGWIVGGEAIYPNQPGEDGVYKWDKTNGVWITITTDGFAVPDMRGRSPVGATRGLWADTYAHGNGWDGAQPLAPFSLGGMKGDWRTGRHLHPLYDANADWASTTNRTNIAPAHSTANSAFAPSPAFAVIGNYTSGQNDWIVAGYSRQNDARGTEQNIQPSTGMNWLVFTGQVVQSHAPLSTNLRDGSVHRLSRLSHEHMIRERLADPNLSDDEREMYEAELNGEPWSRMTEEVS